MRRQLIELFHECREDTLDPQAATRMASILTMAGKMISDGEFERRLVEVERRLRDGKP